MGSMSNDEALVKVGVGVLVIRDGKILLGRRKNAHGAGQHATPGGTLEYGETLFQAVMRELAEECGEQLKVRNLQLLCVGDLLTYTPKHYVDIGFVAEWVSGEPQVCEPDKVEVWEWFDLDQLPTELMDGVAAYIESRSTGKNYYTFLPG